MIKTIAHRYWNAAYPVFYVAGLKGKVGDWEYTTDHTRAIHLSPYWRRRFAADCRAVGVTATFTELTVEAP